MISFLNKSFEELSIQELHDLYLLRSEVFVVEQECIYQDIDGKDSIALHVLGVQKGKILAYARIFYKGDYYKKYASIGRIVVSPKYRKKKKGKLIVEHSIRLIKEKDENVSIKISAQAHLSKFYNKIGFIETGKTYLEDGISHIAMILK